jgi:hypothetical protein
MHVEKWLHQHGKKYPNADPDGSIPLSRFDEAGIPAIVACTECTMTMPLRPDTFCYEDGHVLCTRCTPK